ncbi:hypothetical protein MTP99_019815 [Tenebrio molitor]|nr:hypothetical protein MTP99_019815 [Tenebrio molitor]
MGNQIVVCDLPVPRLGAKTAVSPVLFLPEGKKDVTPRIGSRNGDPCSVFRASVPRRGHSRHPLVKHSQKPYSVSPSTSGSCLLPESLGPEDPHPVQLPGTAHVGPKAPLSAPAAGHH